MNPPLLNPPPDALERLCLIRYVWCAEKLHRLATVSRRFPQWLVMYAEWDDRRREAARTNWGP